MRTKDARLPCKEQFDNIPTVMLGRSKSKQRPAMGGSEAPMEQGDLGHVWHLLSAIGKSMRIQYLTNAYCLPPSKNS